MRAARAARTPGDVRGLTVSIRRFAESAPVGSTLFGVERSSRDIPGRTRTRWKLSNKPAVSKASPLGKDIKSIVLYNVIAVLSMVLFAALGLSVAAAATSAAGL